MLRDWLLKDDEKKAINLVIEGYSLKEIGKILGGNGGGKDNLAKGSVVSIENINKLEGIF